MLFNARLRDEGIVVEVYAIDTFHDAFLIDYHGKFRWFARTEFVPIEE